MSRRLHYAYYPHDHVAEEHDERVISHQDGRCHAQQRAGIRADGPTTMPCDKCEPCRLIRDALAGRDEPTPAQELVLSLIREVENLRAGKTRLEQDLAWERQQVAARTRDRDAWKKEAWAAQEDAEAAA